MKVLFVGLGQESLGLGYLSAALKRAGHTTEMAFDPGLFRDGYQHFDLPAVARFFDARDMVTERIARADPDMVCFTALSSTFVWGLDIARWVKRHTHALVGFGGIHVTTAPEYVIGCDDVDFIGIGEAEESLTELCAALERNDGSHRSIAGIWFKEGGQVHRNPNRPAEPDLDRYGMPDKQLYENDLNLSSKYRIMTTRGCPQACTFCTNAFYQKLYKGKYLRRRSPQNVLEELREAKRRYNMKWIAFYDDIFSRDQEWLDEFLPRFKREIGVHYSCNGYPKGLTPALIEQLHDSGCRYIEIGVQSTDESVRRRMLARRESNDDVAQVVATCNRLGIFLQVDQIFGFDNETEDDRIRAMAWYNEIRPARVGCFQLSLFPGIRLLERAKSQGLIGEKEMEIIESGGLNSYHEGGSLDPAIKDQVLASEFILRMIPLLPRPLIRFLLDKKRYRVLGRLPLALAHFLDFLGGLHPGNNVLFTYIDNYARWMARLFRWRVRRKLAGHAPAVPRAPRRQPETVGKS